MKLLSPLKIAELRYVEIGPSGKVSRRLYGGNAVYEPALRRAESNLPWPAPW